MEGSEESDMRRGKDVAAGSVNKSSLVRRDCLNAFVGVKTSPRRFSGLFEFSRCRALNFLIAPATAPLFSLI